ncbi:hypothetical protein A2631_03690 [Candidatus Daviesbacteria bacterium RIFCSPHIGHO2_01_FULL_44_29]|uniref:Probable endonuclease 4 n=1 Tax=Candidatus Daviesbacteria bacterium RIFCSPHIGHO2_02_FULL_43_12 TaxID=1797776 RepID=A0A1F5KHR4_9BACT|nr:MAG: hypothetical protein A2631_03690 [Candidatus Daviesbacteria bacterium RIFCSPHIGHO2_01_FULL_44_29]OGE39835.1 MAG: hypothetical protein A3E86_04615 [Candidatus Daviesbacteria bacterium RIFCSPHIGHO2_12_FULL_47_45]OGE40487.1 MAG: hypothetical protein A3D25_00150 [Candidatus Daviesbacteria bacterium RIFCSPHIGHO2_02_FULL_43_12]OGE70040.1 MAG: hypothetical protein A3B55_04955 [Candidatus Daviesbacteria bacterium RIFCSPLOWO2_01_FULL_43_15]
MKIGAHISSAGSIDLSFDRAKEMGAECMQIFISPPQMWVKPEISPQKIERFRKKAEESGIGPNFIHGVYLANLATSSPESLEKSIDWLRFSLKTADILGLKGTIIHVGSHKGSGFAGCLKQVAQAIKEILDSSNSSFSYLILENCAGSGGTIGCNFNELGQILKQVRSDLIGVQDDRLKVCLDTQHAFASGYDLRTEEGVWKTLQEFDQEIGLENLIAIHANDSKTELGSKKDRHENIGQGLIKEAGFRFLIKALQTNPKVSDVVLLLEVPGLEGKGPDKPNLDLLKSYLK